MFKVVRKPERNNPNVLYIIDPKQMTSFLRFNRDEQGNINILAGTTESFKPTTERVDFRPIMVLYVMEQDTLYTAVTQLYENLRGTNKQIFSDNRICHGQNFIQIEKYGTENISYAIYVFDDLSIDLYSENQCHMEINYNPQSKISRALQEFYQTLSIEADQEELSKSLLSALGCLISAVKNVFVNYDSNKGKMYTITKNSNNSNKSKAA